MLPANLTVVWPGSGTDYDWHKQI